MGVVGGIPSHHGFAKSSGWSRAAPDTHRPPDFSGRLPMTSGCLELFFDITAFWPKIFVQNCASFNLALGPQLILFLMISLNSNIEFCGYHLIPIFDKAKLLLRLYLAKFGHKKSATEHLKTRTQLSHRHRHKTTNLACGRAGMVGQLGFRRQIKVHPGSVGGILLFRLQQGDVQKNLDFCFAQIWVDS